MARKAKARTRITIELKVDRAVIQIDCSYDLFAVGHASGMATPMPLPARNGETGYVVKSFVRQLGHVQNGEENQHLFKSL